MALTLLLITGTADALCAELFVMPCPLLGMQYMVIIANLRVSWPVTLSDPSKALAVSKILAPP